MVWFERFRLSISSLQQSFNTATFCLVILNCGQVTRSTPELAPNGISSDIVR